MFKLVIQDDEGKTTVVPLIRDEITIGRKEGNTIRLTERNVSRRHARILRNNGEVQIEDLGSYNGIRVNNARIAERVSLRVSDQVQIGDYKLYLKAEGIEQVDDARTMPIERVENGVPATESMPAMAAPAPTAPVPVQAAPAAAPGVVGAPSRTLVDMDGQTLQKLRDATQRPIADPAMVAKLSETASYGRFVILSSNFAGKEFELKRPQMIIGRTDENDIVVNHRSISRNHAKIVREPETGRYTISDLQSSNGVRVNGQDYGKVELRKGDVVDLGHVRLRFVEPGEDYVFSAKDVMDVPEGGGKRGMMAAIVIAVLLVGAIGVYFAFLRETGPSGGEGSGTGTNGSNNGLATVDARGSDNVVVQNTPDAAEQHVEVTPPDAAQQAVGSNPPPTSDGKDIEDRCNQLKAKEQWADLEQCAKDLRPFMVEKSGAFTTLAKNENAASIQLAKLKTEVGKNDIETAKTTLGQIPQSSIYRAEADQLYSNAHDKYLREARSTAAAFARKNQCDNLDNYRSRQPADIKRDLASIECKAAGTTPGPGSGSGSAAVSGPPPGCSDADIAAHNQNAQNAYGAGNYTAALGEWETVFKCNKDYAALTHAYMAACKGQAYGKAKAYYHGLNASDQNRLLQMCLPDFDPRK